MAEHRDNKTEHPVQPQMRRDSRVGTALRLFPTLPAAVTDRDKVPPALLERGPLGSAKELKIEQRVQMLNVGLHYRSMAQHLAAVD